MSAFKQYIGRRSAEERVVKAALDYVNAHDWNKQEQWHALRNACRQLEEKMWENEG